MASAHQRVVAVLNHVPESSAAHGPSDPDVVSRFAGGVYGAASATASFRRTRARQPARPEQPDGHSRDVRALESPDGRDQCRPAGRNSLVREAGVTGVYADASPIPMSSPPKPESRPGWLRISPGTKSTPIFSGRPARRRLRKSFERSSRVPSREEKCDTGAVRRRCCAAGHILPCPVSGVSSEDVGLVVNPARSIRQELKDRYGLGPRPL